jgi:hypothetical protein
MESKLLLGHSTYKGQTVRDAQGMPVMVSKPILEPDEWDRLQAAIQARRLPSAVKRTQSTSPLYGVIFCKSCGSMMYNRKYGHRESDRGYTYDYYMCPKSCGRMIHAELIYKLLQKVFLLELGGISAGYILKPTHPGPSWQTAQLGVVWHRICVPSFRENCGCIGWERSSY